MRTRSYIGVVCGFCWLLVSAAVQSQPTPVPDTVGLQFQWRSESKNDVQLAVALERLYLALYNTANLPARIYKDQRGLRPEQILRQEQLFAGAHFPQSLDNILCDLNPPVCNRPKWPVQDKELADLFGHVGGYKLSNATWTNGLNSRLRIPDLRFSSYTNLARVPLAAGISLAEAAQQYKLDCSRWKLPCEEVLNRLNPSAYDSKQPAKDAVLPVTGLKTELVLAFDKRSEVRASLAKQELLETRITSLPERAMPAFAERWVQRLEAVNPADLALQALAPYLLAAGKARAWSATSEPFFQEQRPLFALIHHPFINLNDIPAKFQQAIPIGVLDTRLDDQHCDLGQNVETISLEPNSIERPAADECGKLLPTPNLNLADDHGTHIVGLIAAAKNHKGLIGLNPFAAVKYIQIDTQQFRAPQYRIEVAEHLTDLSLLNEVKAVNISWGYSNEFNGSDPISQRIQFSDRNTLFVVAAGNGKHRYEQGHCPELPACLTDYDNVITVVGLNQTEDTPALWVSGDAGSNSNPEFHIGAIAEDVLSTAFGGYIGRLSGTSQAAPQVTAAASLIYSIYQAHFQISEQELLPVRVRNRLIYTADLFTGLLPHIQSGRLNMERALDVEHDYLMLEDDSGRHTHIGRLSQFGNDPADESIWCRTATQDLLIIKRRDLRRMFFDAHRQTYIVFKNKIAGDRNSAVERVHDCELRTTSHQGVLETDQGPVTFTFRQIRDYISPMFR